MKLLVPLLAMVPRFSTISSSFMPIPVSLTVRVFFSLSKEMTILLGSWSSLYLSSVSFRYSSLSKASLALEMSSLRKISLLE